MLHNAIYTERQTILTVQGICWSTQTAHSAPVSRIWAHVEEWNKPRCPPDTARTWWGIAANTPKHHCPAGYMQLIQQLQDISLPQQPSKDSYALNMKDKVKMWLLGLEGGGSTVLWSTSSTETFLGTATKGVSLYYCYLHCKGSLPFKCGKRIGQIVFPPAGKQEQEKRCAAEDNPVLVSCTRAQRGRFWGSHTLYRTRVKCFMTYSWQ